MKAAALLTLVIMILVSGCTNTYLNVHDNQTSNMTIENSSEHLTEQNTPSVMTARIPEGAHISISGVSVEKKLYHSAETMRFNVSVDSDTAIDGLGISAEGISGKMLIDRKVNITPGTNLFEFEYALPRCNVCGGIRPGNHSLSVDIYYGGLIDTLTLTVEIQQ
ncbi:MAG: hypothetical protein J7K54_01425 [Candidatus Aenigmarchaeota archaeon]|nr:hypothetical protein [Candidatus Aenigmarchaeota archaeon]